MTRRSLLGRLARWTAALPFLAQGSETARRYVLAWNERTGLFERMYR